MKKYTVLISFFTLCTLSTFAQAGLLFNYSQLALKDLDQMSRLVQSKISESRKSGGDKVIPLKECLQAVYSRSNEDLMIEKIISPLKNELDEHEAWESATQDLVTEALGALRNTKAFQPAIQVTYIVYLENVMAEMRSRVGEEFEGKIIRKIRDAKLEVSKAADAERRLRVMKGVRSPSEIAGSILSEYEEARKLKEMEKAKSATTGTPVEKKD